MRLMQSPLIKPSYMIASMLAILTNRYTALQNGGAVVLVEMNLTHRVRQLHHCNSMVRLRQRTSNVCVLRKGTIAPQD